MASGFDKFAKALKDVTKKFKDELKKNNIPKVAGIEAKKIVQERTRKGFGVSGSEGKKVRLPKLKPSTKSIRKDLQRRGGLTGKSATVNKSNFSRTGETLDKIKVSPSNSKVSLELNNHGKDAVRTTEKISKDYNFMDLSKSEVKAINKQAELELQQALKKYLK